MKTNLNLINVFSFLAILFIAGCQDEVVDLPVIQNESVIESNSPVALLIEQTTMLDGSSDNIIDQSSYTTVVLPVTVVANGQELIIQSEDDFKFIERIFDESDTDTDVLDIVFPFVVILPDHSEVLVNNEDEFDELIDGQLEGGDDDDIECLDFTYPLTVSLFDASNQVSDVISILNDEELFNLFESLEEDEFLSFNFPLTLILSDGVLVTVNDNNELEDLIENVADACDEDDDNDFDDDDIDDSDLIAVLINGEWAITRFFDKVDEIADFQDLVFTFFSDGTANASDGISIITGDWITYGDDGTLELEIDFGSDFPLDALQDDWSIIEFGSDIIKLKDISGGDGSEEFLTFERPTNNGGENQLVLSEVIVTGNWFVAEFNNSGEDKTPSFNGFAFTFIADGAVSASDNVVTVDGTWIEVIDNNDVKLQLDFGSTAPFDEISDDWTVINFTDTRIELENVSGGNGTTDTLIFERK